jgi:hypothetical protein
MPWEQGPEIAGVAEVETESMLRFLSAEDDAELAELIDGRTALDINEARRAAKLLVKGLANTADADEFAAEPDADDLLQACTLMADGESPTEPDEFGVADQPGQTGPVAAGGISFDPRDLLRVATVWTMKARAGKVGTVGVGPLVRHILMRSDARLHLIGHSFGARVLLSALASVAGGLPEGRKAWSMLLLQAAVNRWCFAAEVPGTNQPGGYQPVLDKVERPVLTTFSSEDVPLTTFFHLAMRRGSLGEPNTAAIGNEDLYGALGGYGPAGLGELAETQSAIVPNGPQDSYQLSPDMQVIALDCGQRIGGQPVISGHGNVSNAATWWALHCLTDRPAPG